MMREKDIVNIVEVWYQILANFHETHPELVNLCLSCIGTYACETTPASFYLQICEPNTNTLFNFLQPGSKSA